MCIETFTFAGDLVTALVRLAFDVRIAARRSSHVSGPCCIVGVVEDWSSAVYLGRRYRTEVVRSIVYTGSLINRRDLKRCGLM